MDGFPFRTSGKIVSPVTITRLFDGPAQHLLVSCFDGFFYVIDAITQCAGAPPITACQLYADVAPHNSRCPRLPVLCRALVRRSPGHPGRVYSSHGCAPDRTREPQHHTRAPRRADVTDIGDTSYTAVLVDDLDNDGQLELLLSTMSGHLYSFGTPAEYHALKTWPQQVPGQSVFVARHDEVQAAMPNFCILVLSWRQHCCVPG